MTGPASWEICMQIKKQQLELDMEQKAGSRLGTEYVKAVYYHLLFHLPCRVHYVKCGTQAGITIAGRNINNLRYADDTTLMAESEEELKSLLMKVKEKSKKAD